MKVAVITCNIGAMDEIYPPEKQTVQAEYYYFTENNLPFPLPELNNRMKGKYVKTQFHKFIESDIYIWVDGSIEITNENFIQACIDGLQENDIICSLHTQRKTVYDELEYIIDKMKEGDKYLLKRYARQPFYLEYEYYRANSLPKTYPFYNAYFFAIRAESKWMLNDWWEHILRFSNLDQSQFTFCLWANGMKVKCIEPGDFFVRYKHE